MLGDAETVVDRGIAAGGVEPRGALSPRDRRQPQTDLFRAVPRLRHEGRPVLEGVTVAEFADEPLVGQASVTIVWASAFITAALVPGLSGK